MNAEQAPSSLLGRSQERRALDQLLDEARDGRSTTLVIRGEGMGMGVREAVMILLLTSIIGEPAAALVALVFRLVTTLGDIVFFLISLAPGWRVRAQRGDVLHRALGDRDRSHTHSPRCRFRRRDRKRPRHRGCVGARPPREHRSHP